MHIRLGVLQAVNVKGGMLGDEQDALVTDIALHGELDVGEGILVGLEDGLVHLVVLLLGDSLGITKPKRLLAVHLNILQDLLLDCLLR